MDRFKSRLATSSDVSALYDLLSEYVIEQDLGDHFTNSLQNFREHFRHELFKALVTEVSDEKENRREIVGCGFLSFTYTAGTAGFLHCCYLKPAYRDHGLEQVLIKLAKKVALDSGIHNMLMTIDRSDVKYISAVEEEGGVDISTMPNGASDLWFMSNPSSTQEFSNDDYLIREAKPEDLGGVFTLLENLIKFENIEQFVSITKTEFERNGEVDKDFYGSVILEHRCRVGDHGGETKVTLDIVGCMLYTKMYYASKGNTYYLQGLYIIPDHKGRGLGKALVKASLKACLDRNSDGFIFMILHGNIVSQSLFQSLHGINMTDSKNLKQYALRC